MDTREFVLREDASNKIITDLLIRKFGEEAIQGLLSDDTCIVPNPSKGQIKPYIRGWAKVKNVLSDEYYEGSPDDVLPASTLLTALEDAGNNMNYSNWHNDKFDRAAEIIIRYCEEHDIPVSFAASGDE